MIENLRLSLVTDIVEWGTLKPWGEGDGEGRKPTKSKTPGEAQGLEALAFLLVVVLWVSESQVGWLKIWEATPFP